MEIDHNAVLLRQGEDEKPLFRHHAWPVLRGQQANSSVPARAHITGASRETDPNGPWLAPIPIQWQGEMISGMAVQTDGQTTIVREKPQPSLFEGKDSPFLGPMCIPPTLEGIEWTPVSDPYALGVDITFNPTNLTGSEPFAYSWQINGAERSTSETFIYTTNNTDPSPPDPDGVGVVAVQLIVSNDCGQVSSDFYFINVQVV